MHGRSFLITQRVTKQLTNLVTCTAMEEPLGGVNTEVSRSYLNRKHQDAAAEQNCAKR